MQNEFNKFNNMEALMLYLSYGTKINLKSHFWCENIVFCHIMAVIA